MYSSFELLPTSETNEWFFKDCGGDEPLSYPTKVKSLSISYLLWMSSFIGSVFLTATFSGQFRNRSLLMFGSIERKLEQDKEERVLK